MGTKYAKRQQLEQIERDLKHMKTQKENPHVYGGLPDRRAFDTKLKQLEAQRDRLTPPPVKTDAERRQLESRLETLNAFMKMEVPEIRKPAMPSEYQQEHAPAGAVGHHLAWERGMTKYNVDRSGKVVPSGGYSADDERRDIIRRLHGDEEEYNPDLVSVENERPANRDNSSFSDYARMTFAQGRGITQEQWDETVGPKPEPEVKAVAAEVPVSSVTIPEVDEREAEIRRRVAQEMEREEKREKRRAYAKAYSARKKGQKQQEQTQQEQGA